MKKSVFLSWILFFSIFFRRESAYAYPYGSTDVPETETEEEESTSDSREEDYSRRLEELSQESDELSAEQLYNTMGVGLGVAMPSDFRLDSLGTFEINIRNFFGCYYTGAGLCLGMSALEEFWHFKVRYAGVGLFLWGGEEITIPEINRGWDVMMTSGVDVSVWRGLELRAQLQWFFPNPGAVFRFAGREAEAGLREEDASARKVGRTAWHRLSNTYAGALMTPAFYLGVRWEF